MCETQPATEAQILACHGPWQGMDADADRPAWELLSQRFETSRNRKGHGMEGADDTSQNTGTKEWAVWTATVQGEVRSGQRPTRIRGQSPDRLPREFEPVPVCAQVVFGTARR